MKLGTRLLVSLLPPIALVMVLYGVWTLANRERHLVAHSRQEAQTYATALGLAFEYAFRDLEHEGVQQLINKLASDSSIYGIIVYGSDGKKRYISDPLTTPQPAPARLLRRVLTDGSRVTFERQIDDQRVFSVLRALTAPHGAVVGALEIAQPLAFVEEERPPRNGR